MNADSAFLGSGRKSSMRTGPDDEYQFVRGAVGEGHPKQRGAFKSMNL